MGRGHFAALALRCCAVVAAAGALLAQDKIATRRHEALPAYDARIVAPGRAHESGPVRPLSAPRIVQPKSAVRLAGDGSSVTAAAVYLQSALRLPEHASLRHLRTLQVGTSTVVDFQATVDGVPLFEGVTKIALGAGGDVIATVGPGLVPLRADAVGQSMDAEQAVRHAFGAAGLDAPGQLTRATSEAFPFAFANSLSAGLTAVLAEPTVFALDETSARPAWRVLLEVSGEAWYEMVIDSGDGRLLFRNNLYDHLAQLKVFRQTPLKAERDLFTAPIGWLGATETETKGNNADAYLDANGDNEPDLFPEANISAGRASSPSQVFDFPAPGASESVDPRRYKAGAVTNAFYFANLAHDFFYSLGFDEASGNFQQNNGTRGGRGGDPVRVEVHDRNAINNATMATPPDGVSPRMQLGIFTRGTMSLTDDRDSAYDGLVHFHEYTHGVSRRLVGGGAATSCLSGIQAGALNEGWSDYFAASYFNDPVQGAYLTGNGQRGIRRQSYEGYTFTYEDLGNEGFEVHDDGEIWAATLWDIRKSLGGTTTDKLVYTALGLTPCRPTFVDARDAILAADRALFNGNNRTRLFTVFARHGLGGAASSVSEGPRSGLVFNAAFDVPSDLPTVNRAPHVESRPPGVATGGQQFSYQIKASDADGGTLRYEVASGPAGLTVDSSTGIVRWLPTFASQRIRIAISDGQGGRTVHGFELLVATPAPIGRPVEVSLASGSGFIAVDVPPQTQVLQVAARGGTGDPDFRVTDPNGARWPFHQNRSDTFETLVVGEPMAGTWLIAVSAARPVERAVITATLPMPRLLSGAGSPEPFNGDISSQTFFRLAVPPGASSLKVDVSAASGDPDVVLRRQRIPTCQVFAYEYSFYCAFDRPYASFNITTADSVTVPNPAAGDWYINVTTGAGYTGAIVSTRLEVQPSLVVSANSLRFASYMGSGSGPPAQSIRVTNPAGTAYSWAASVNPGANWLTIGNPAGSGDGNLSVSVNPAGLAPGTYTGTVTLTAAGLSSSPQVVTVTLVLGPRPVISSAATSLGFGGAPGETPAPQWINFTNTGGGTLSWTATANGGDWLSVAPQQGTGNGAVQVSARGAGLAPGTYQGSITLAATDAVPVTVRVTYVVSAPLTIEVVEPRTRPVCPGDLLSVAGKGFVPGNSRVSVNGVNARVVQGTPSGIRFVVPFDVQGSEARIVISVPGYTAPAIIRALRAQSPSLFTVLDSEAGAGRILHADGSLVSRAAPLQPEEEVSLLASGLGAVNASGETLSPVKVFVDGAEARVLAAVLDADQPGVYRVRAVMPPFLATRFPKIVVQSAAGDSESNEVSAGGPSLLDATPASVPRGADAAISIRGWDLPEGAAVKIGEETIAGELIAPEAGSLLQTLRVTIPARLLPPATAVALVIVNPAAADEPPSNALTLPLQ